jgi:DNA-binding GntR family transcriptional regulator
MGERRAQRSLPAQNPIPNGGVRSLRQECCGYEALCVAIQRNQILIFNWLYDTATGRRTMPPNHHGRLAKSLCSQDPLVADKSMRLHVAHGRDEVLATLEKLTSK